MARIVVQRLAARELEDALLYYETLSPGLGTAFLDEWARCLRRLLVHPQSGVVVDDDVRRLMLRRFPYALLYRHSRDVIRVLAVMNLRRRPMYWVGR